MEGAGATWPVIWVVASGLDMKGGNLQRRRACWGHRYPIRVGGGALGSGPAAKPDLSRSRLMTAGCLLTRRPRQHSRFGLCNFLYYNLVWLIPCTCLISHSIPRT